MNSNQAKKIPLIEILDRLGHQPVRHDKGGIEWVYKSPFRSEKEPSLFVNVKANIWNDFGDIGGNVLDFVMRYENTDVKGALRFLENMFSKKVTERPRIAKTNFGTLTPAQEEKLILDEIKPLKHPALIQYLTKERAINLSIAKKYLVQAHFHNSESDKNYFSLAMENMSGGYEIRNPFFKSSLGKKDITIIHGKGRGEVAVFEGHMDFLSYLTDKNKRQLETDVLILNSVAFAEKAKSLIQAQSYSKIYTFFDNDKKGQETLTSFQELPIEVVPCNHIYHAHKDYNLFLQYKTHQQNISR